MRQRNNKELIILAGGGTGGHIFPLLSVYKNLRKNENLDFEYFGTGARLERELAKENGLKYKKIFSGKLRRDRTLSAFLKNIVDFFVFVFGIFQALLAILDRKPVLVFSKGGFGSLPVVLAASVSRVPIISHESDIEMGLSNKIALRLASRIGVGFPLDAYPRVIRDKAFYAGVPLREEFNRIYHGRQNSGSYLLVIGGSSGALALNELVYEIAPRILEKTEIVHLTGELGFPKAQEFKNLLPKTLQGRYKPISFSNEMSELISGSKAVVSRAGATAVFEIAACRKRAIFVPIPKYVTGHQILNAVYLKREQLAEMHFQDDKPENLVNKIEGVLTKEDNDLGRIYFPKSTELISQVILDEIEKAKLKKISRIFLIGICGVSMSAIAQMLEKMGKKISGSDLKLGGHSAQNITTDLDLVVYSSAATDKSAARVEHEKAKSLKIPIIKRSEMIGWLMRGKCGICVAGMHGKTTISSLLARMFEISYSGTSYLIGAESTPANPTINQGPGKFFIAEACEYDDSFLDFPTTIAVISNIEEEHLDYFRGGLKEIKAHFSTFIRKIYPGGALVYCADDHNVYSVVKENIDELVEKRIKLVSYGFKPTADYSISKYKVEKEKAEFSVTSKKGTGVFKSTKAGKHFALNVAAAYAVSRIADVDESLAEYAVANFRGALRRFTRVAEVGNIKLIDDYAHHPTEISATLNSLNELYPKERKMVVFEPHQQDRFNRFFDEFVKAFKNSKIDVVVVLPVYRVAGRDAQAKHSSQDLVDFLTKSGKGAFFVQNYDEAVKFLTENASSNDIIMTMGATDVWKVAHDFVKNKKKGL